MALSRACARSAIDGAEGALRVLSALRGEIEAARSPDADHLYLAAGHHRRVPDFLAQQRLRQGGDIGHRPARRVGLVLADDAEGLPPAIGALEGDRAAERHTQTPVEGLGHLLDWINAQPGRGCLEYLGEGRWLWALTDRELVEVRPQLNAAGMLYSCKERVYRDLPDGAVVSQRIFQEQAVDWAPWVSDARLDYPERFAF